MYVFRLGVTGVEQREAPNRAYQAQDCMRSSSSSVWPDAEPVEGTHGHKGDHDCCQIMSCLKTMVRKAKVKDNAK